MRLVIDGMNVIGTRPDGWWRDRDRAVRRLYERLSTYAYADTTPATVTLVLEGRRSPTLPTEPTASVTVAFARQRGRHAADDRIVELVADDEDPASILVITSDRDLRRRVEELGASVESSGAFLERLDRFERLERG